MTKKFKVVFFCRHPYDFNVAGPSAGGGAAKTGTTGTHSGSDS
jgi:hypothetical protein